MHHLQEIIGEELVKVLQIKNKIPRRKALSLLEEKVLTILTEKGYVSKDESVGTVETIPDLLEEEDEDEEVVVDGEVDEGDVHIRPISRKPTPLVKPVCTLLSGLPYMIEPDYKLQYLIIHPMNKFFLAFFYVTEFLQVSYCISSF